MKLRLILMRHAKSDWDTPAGGDFERPLNKRGRKSAVAIGRWLAENRYLPDLVLCSSAARTRETWSLVLGELGVDPPSKFLRALYLASPDEMFQEAAQVQGADCVMMIAHNPGSAILASALAERAPPHGRFEDYPTAATTVFEFNADSWALIRPGVGQIVNFVVPRDLVSS